MIKWVVFIALIVTLGGSIAYLIYSQSYPILVVNSHAISSKEFGDDLTAVLHYYGKVVELANRRKEEIVDPRSEGLEIKKALLQGLIEDRLISEELERRINKSDLELIASNKIDTALRNSNIPETDIEKEVQLIYGISLEDFKINILGPQVRREILEGRMTLENNSGDGGFDAWLKKVKSGATVFVLLPGFYWDGEKVTVK